MSRIDHYSTIIQEAIYSALRILSDSEAIGILSVKECNLHFLDDGVEKYEDLLLFFMDPRNF